MNRNEFEKKLLNVFSNLTDLNDQDSWTSLISRCGELIRNDNSLRGDLAHQLLYFQSERSVCKLSIKAIVEVLQEFQAGLLEHSNNAIHEIRSDQTIRKFILRESNTISAHRGYANVVLFLVATAYVDGDRFFRHFVHKEIGDLRLLIGGMHAVLKSNEPSLRGMLEYVEQFQQTRPNRKVIKHDLGGMMELGSHDPDTLWGTVFRKNRTDYAGYSSEPSLEKYFVAYRYSSYGQFDRIVKSFVVLQSPGAIREHFAFKNFFKFANGQLRRSAGAVIALGNTVTCFGSSRMLLDGDRPGGLDNDPNQIVGPKSIIMDIASLKSDEPMVPCHLLSMNQNEEVFSSRMICVRTSFAHSSHVDIGTFSISKFADELGQYTDFGDGRLHEKPKEQRNQIWNFILEALKLPEGANVETALTKKDLDLRRILSD